MENPNIKNSRKKIMFVESVVDQVIMQIVVK